MIRVFIAVELSCEIRNKLSFLQDQLKTSLPPMNWVRPESIHLTLKFLGDVDPSRISELLGALELVGQKLDRFTMNVQGLGVFPSLRRPRIFWVGVHGQTDALQEMVLEIEATLEPLGFPLEEKSYHPHVTLVRIKRDNALIGVALEEHKTLEQDQRVGTVHVDHFILFQSRLGASGATYTSLGIVKLSGNSPESSRED